MFPLLPCAGSQRDRSCLAGVHDVSCRAVTNHSILQCHKDGKCRVACSNSGFSAARSSVDKLPRAKGNCGAYKQVRRHALQGASASTDLKCWGAWDVTLIWTELTQTQHSSLQQSPCSKTAADGQNKVGQRRIYLYFGFSNTALLMFFLIEYVSKKTCHSFIIRTTGRVN